MRFKFTVKNHTLTPCNLTDMRSGNDNYYSLLFDFVSEDWENLVPFAVFATEVSAISVPIFNNVCIVPSEALLKDGNISLGVFGTSSGENHLRISTNQILLPISKGAYDTASAPSEPTPDMWEQCLKEITRVGGLAQTAQDASDDAKKSALEAKHSENCAAQALSDLLSMLGTDIATLIDGKIPPSQIPSIATTQVYSAESASQMNALEVENGDICIRTDENKSYIMSDGSWVYLVSPTDYSSKSGYAETSGTAENALKINNHRLVEMSASQFEAAAKDPDTYYLVYEDN